MDLPDFDDSVRALESRLTMDEMASSHGLLCGLLCAFPDLGMEQYEIACRGEQLPVAIDGESSALMQELLECSKRQLNDTDMAVGLWLPEDDEPLAIRTATLAAWCSGFVSGLSQACGAQLMQISDDLSEIVTDLGEIAQADVAADSEDEAGENAFMEIVEFVRVAVLLVQEELRGPRGHDSVH